MYQLLRQNFLAALVSKNVPNIDILVSDLAGKPLGSLQVKTMREPGKKWQLKSSAETAVEGLFYCFVRPSEPQIRKPDCWIIPSSIVAEHVKLSHQSWLAGAEAAGRNRNDGDKRSMHFECEPLDLYPNGWMDQYFEAWNLLR
ncbi:hypothetical protein [Tsuneonella deserti]|nr:hypothetical protein [Tsuneonella deserti]